MNARVLQIPAALLSFAVVMNAYHFKGLPHYNYFENYPQTPEEEYHGNAGGFEFSLAVFDLQGINKEMAETPDNVRLFLLAYNSRTTKLHNGPLELSLRSGGKEVRAEKFDSADEENIYSILHELDPSKKHSLHITIPGHEIPVSCEIPFQLSSQETHWGLAVWGSLFLLITIAAIGARRSRIREDRRQAATATG